MEHSEKLKKIPIIETIFIFHDKNLLKNSKKNFLIKFIAWFVGLLIR